MTFDIDANGIVNVSARDKGTGKEQQSKLIYTDSRIFYRCKIAVLPSCSLRVQTFQIQACEPVGLW